MASRNSKSASAPRDSGKDSPASEESRSPEPKARREYRVHSTTTARGFINGLTRHNRGDGKDTLYFVKVGMLTGREFVPTDGNRGSYRDRVQFLDLLVGAPLRHLFENQFAAAGLDSDELGRVSIERGTPGFSLDGVLFDVEIHDLHFSADVSDREQDHPGSTGSRRAYLKTESGVLMGIALRPFEGGNT